jgi:hypothetical protein
MLRNFLNRWNKKSSATEPEAQRRTQPRSLALERLEDRQLLSTIIWTNRGDTIDLNGNGALDSGEVGDGFNLAYGNDAARAREIVDRAIRDWEAVIADFNYSDGSNTFRVEIVAAEMQSPVNFILNWTGPSAHSFGNVNAGQSFSSAPAPATIFINEIHYDNSGRDVGEAIELAGPAGTDLQNWQLVLYDGTSGTVYDTINLNGIIPDQQNGYGTLSFAVPNLRDGRGGIALVDPTNSVVRIEFRRQFLSYGGEFTAVGGPADGITTHIPHPSARVGADKM